MARRLPGGEVDGDQLDATVVMEEGALEERHRAFAESLSREERLLVRLRDELYDGSWADLELDLRARQDQKPFVFKLNTRIDEDLRRIERLRGYEREHQVDLRPLVERAASAAGEGREP